MSRCEQVIKKRRHGRVNEIVMSQAEAEHFLKYCSLPARARDKRGKERFTILLYCLRRCIVKMYYGRGPGRVYRARGLISCLHLIVPVLEQRLRVVLLTATSASAARGGGFTFTSRGYTPASGIYVISPAVTSLALFPASPPPPPASPPPPTPAENVD